MSFGSFEARVLLASCAWVCWEVMHCAPVRIMQVPVVVGTHGLHIAAYMWSVAISRKPAFVRICFDCHRGSVTQIFSFLLSIMSGWSSSGRSQHAERGRGGWLSGGSAGPARSHDAEGGSYAGWWD